MGRGRRSTKTPRARKYWLGRGDLAKGMSQPHSSAKARLSVRHRHASQEREELFVVAVLKDVMVAFAEGSKGEHARAHATCIR